MTSAVLHVPPWPGVRAHIVRLRGIHFRTDPAPHAQGRFRLFRLLLRHAEVKSLAFTDPGGHPVLEPMRSHRKLDGYSKNVGALGFEPRTSRL